MRIANPLIPTWTVQGVPNIDFKLLAEEEDIRYALLDLDDTIARPLSTVCRDAIGSIIDAIENGWLLDVCILSNCWSFLFAPRVRWIARRHGFKYHACYLPYPLKPQRAVFEKALDNMPGSTACDTVVIGDGVDTDILGGNLMGMRTILVPMMEPVSLWRKWQYWKNRRLMSALGIEFPPPS